MGRGDDNLLEDERADRVMRRLLDNTSAPTDPPAPPDLVSRALRRLPPVPPALVAAREARRRRQRTALALAVLVPVALVAALNIWSVAGEGPQLAFLVGDGRHGASSVLLGIQLAAKPFWNTMRAIGVAVFAGCALVVAVAAVLSWRLVRGAHAAFDAEDE